MCRRGRVDHEGFYVGDVREQREELERVDEFEGLRLTALYVEGEYRSAAVREILLIERVIGVLRQRGVVYLLDERVLYEVLDYY